MKLRYRLRTILQFISFAFYPKVTVCVCVIATIIIDLILGYWLHNTPKECVSYDILLAILTGVTASFIVSIIIELTNNYRHNKLAWYELHDYYTAVNDYEMHKQILMQNSPHQRAEIKAREELGISPDEDFHEAPKDIIEATWKYLPEIMPVFKNTLENKKAFLSDREINELKNIVLVDYYQIRTEIHMLLMMSPVFHNVMNHPDDDYLDYPRNILDDIPEWMRNSIARNENQKSLERLADEILSDAFLINDFMEGYDISQSGIDNYNDPYEKEEATYEDGQEDEIDYEEYDFSEPDNEDEFIELHNEQDQILREMYRPFVSWHISQNCKDISESIDILEKEILKKPYYGTLLKFERKLPKKSIKDPIYQMDYEREKRRLEKSKNK